MCDCPQQAGGRHCKSSRSKYLRAFTTDAAHKMEWLMVRDVEGLRPRNGEPKTTSRVWMWLCSLGNAHTTDGQKKEPREDRFRKKMML